MEQFAYSFIITMLHSIWQMALLLFIYFAAMRIMGNWHPLAKRNFLLILLAGQLLLTGISFYLIYNAPFIDYRQDVQDMLQALGASQSWLQEYSSWLFVVYSFAVLYKISFSTTGWFRFRNRLKSEMIKPSLAIRHFTNTGALRFGIKRKVQVWMSNHIQSPMVYGFFKPVILLPVAMLNHLSVEQTEALIIHELTHIKQQDYLYNWLLLFTEAIYCFNPFVKIALQHIKIEREKNCDIQVLHFSYPAVSYAEALLLIAKNQAQPLQVPVAAVNKNSELLNRIRYFSTEHSYQKHSGKSLPLFLILFSAIVLLNIFLTGMHLKQQTGMEHFTRIVIDEARQVQQAASTVYEIGQTIHNSATDIAYNNDPVITDETTQQPLLSEEKSSTGVPATLSPEQISTPAETNALPEPASEAEEEINNESSNTHTTIATTVSLINTAPLAVKDVVITEQNNKGQSITRVYRLTQSGNGSWTVEPLWMTSEQPLTDSLKLLIKKDSTVLRMIPVVQ